MDTDEKQICIDRDPDAGTHVATPPAGPSDPLLLPQHVSQRGFESGAADAYVLCTALYVYLPPVVPIPMAVLKVS